MIYNHNFGRYLALCRKNDIANEGAHYIARINSYDLKSPEHVALWVTMFSQRLDAELAMIPDDMSYEDTEYAMECALAACKDDLREILWFAPVDSVQVGRDSLEQIESTSCEKHTAPSPAPCVDALQPSGVQTPFDILPILKKLDEIEKSLSEMQKTSERIPEYRTGDGSSMTQ